MLRLIGKYRHTFLVGLQGNLVYRWNFALRSCFSLLHLVFIFLLWGAAFAGQTTIGGFGLDATLTYFIALFILHFFVGAFNEDYQISEEIRNGLINQFLLKPVNYYAYRFTIFLASRLVSGCLALVPFLLCLPLLKGHLVLPCEPWRLALGLPALLLSALIQFTIAYCFGLLTFWFLEIQSFVVLSYAVETLLGGQVFPLDLLPAALFRVSQFLPYYYQMYFPVAIFTGRLGQAAAVEGLCVQVFWTLALLAIASLLWKRGLRRHTAVGG
ncbi:MAG: ABC-2 family transporter protein [Opitutaceae bacterium]|jgi:ABC-2 type transport system permease protein|nr:ABC-2 family transporter protein [Opitutaceae bacterium]